MKIPSILLLAFALMATALNESRAQPAATVNDNTDSWGVAATLNYDTAEPPRGDTPESTRMLTYISNFRDFSDSNIDASFLFNMLGFLRGGEVNGLNTSSRILTTETVAFESLDSTEIFPLLFRSFSVRNNDLSQQDLEVTYVRGSNSISINGGLLSGDDADPILGFVSRALLFRSNYDNNDAKLQDVRYTLD